MNARLFAMAAGLWRGSPGFVRQGVLRLTQRTYTLGVVGLVPDERNAILLLRHRFRVPYPWGLPGGYLEAGEDPGQALARELEEEVGIRAEPRPGVLEHELNHATRSVSYFVLMSTLVAPVPRMNPVEVLDYRFCSLDSLPVGLQPTHAEVLRRYWLKHASPTKNLVVVPCTSIEPLA